ASVVYKPRPGHFLRASFSSAIRNPTLTDQYLNLNVGRAILLGNIGGFDSLITVESFRDYTSCLCLDTLQYFNVDPVQPEKVKTFEVGYRATLFNSLYVDAGYYYSIYTDFLGYNIGIDATFSPEGLPEEIQAYRLAANSKNKVTTQGFAIGLNYYFGNYYMLSGNYSWNRLNINDDIANDPIIPAFNTPEHKYNIGLSGRNVQMRLGDRYIRNFGFSINYKWVQGFVFEGSPQFTGYIPSYDLLDAQVNYTIDKWNTTVKLGASNLLNNLHYESYGGPKIGRLAYLTVLYEFKKK
ncbi:MAG: TonB-dependent receptor, partial [Bacteroidetes bacterium]